MDPRLDAPYIRPVERSDSHRTPGDTPRGARPEPEPALRDAAEILARVAADEVAADQARERYRLGPMIPVAPEPPVAAILEPGEDVLATRFAAVLEGRGSRPELDVPGGLVGDLVVTSRRLLFVGRTPLSIDLTDIEEAVLAGERLLLVLRDGRGVSVQVAWPRLLRVEIAAARAGIRALSDRDRSTIGGQSSS